VAENELKLKRSLLVKVISRGFYFAGESGKEFEKKAVFLLLLLFLFLFLFPNWLSHYSTSPKVAASILENVIEFHFNLPNNSSRGGLSLHQEWVP
jgi:hypothetical protein